MQQLSLPRFLCVVGVLLALMPALLSAAAKETAKSKPVPNPIEQVRNKLERSGNFKPDEQWTLKDALDWLANQYDLAFVVDELAFEDARWMKVQGARIAEKEKWELKDVKVKEMLRELLKRIRVFPAEATYVVIGKTIVITTDKWAPYNWMRQIVNVDCDKEELSSVIKKLAQETGTNLVIDVRAAKEAEMRVTVQMRAVTLETAVMLLAEMAGLKPVRVDNVLFLTTKKNATQILSDPARRHVVGPCPVPSMIHPGDVGTSPE